MSEIKYLHYWHFADRWYMKINSEKEFRVMGKYEYDIYSYLNDEEYLIPDSEGLTKRQIKEYLKSKYPDLILVKAIAYHEGRRWFGNKKGSRRYNTITTPKY